MVQRVAFRPTDTNNDTPAIEQNTFVPFDTGARILTLSNFVTHHQAEGYRGIGESLTISGVRLNIGGQCKEFEFIAGPNYRVKADPVGGNKIFKIEDLRCSRMALVDDGAYPVNFLINAVYNSENGQLMVMGTVINNRTDKPISVDKIYVSYKE